MWLGGLIKMEKGEMADRDEKNRKQEMRGLDPKRGNRFCGDGGFSGSTQNGRQSVGSAGDRFICRHEDGERREKSEDSCVSLRGGGWAFQWKGRGLASVWSRGLVPAPKFFDALRLASSAIYDFLWKALGKLHGTTRR